MTSSARPVAALLAAFASAVPALPQAASLQPATAAEYRKYAAKVESDMAAQARAGGFLWAPASTRVDDLKAGKVVVLPAINDGDAEVTGGVIHDWAGAIFVPGAALPQALQLLKDYANYKDYYGPEIAESRVVSGSGNQFKVALRLQKKFVLSMVIQAEFDVRFTEISPKQWTSTASATKFSEVENAGTPQEKVLPEGQGSGLLWTTNSYLGLLERDGGIYIEMRALSLSNPLPPAMSLLRPVLVKLPGDSLVTTLEATRKRLSK